jgi:hypothetical protein
MGKKCTYIHTYIHTYIEKKREEDGKEMYIGRGKSEWERKRGKLLERDR